MSAGVKVDLDELIDLRRYATKINYESSKMERRHGNSLSKLRGRGMDFMEVRNYQPGDEVRHMEWRVTARTGKPHVKLYQEERERPAIITVDFTPSMYFGTRLAFKSVIAAKLATILAWTAITDGDRVGALLTSAQEHDEFIPKGREKGVLPILAALSEYTYKYKQMLGTADVSIHNFSEVLIRLRRVARPGSIIVLVGDFYNIDADAQRHLNRLRAHNDILAYHIIDKIELAPPEPDIYAVTNGVEEMVLDTTKTKVADAYQEYCETKIAKAKELFAKLKIQYVQVMADMDLALLVRSTYPRRRCV